MYDIEKILLELEKLPKFKVEICLQGTKDNLNPFYGNGCASDIVEPEGELAFNVPIFDLPYVNKIITELDIYRTRVMRLIPKTCYTYHKDRSNRLHIPLITNDKCFFIINKRVSHLPATGEYYILPTKEIHTAINAGSEERLHIVGVVKDDVPAQCY